MQNGKQVPGVAPTAMQQGRYAATAMITARLRGQRTGAISLPRQGKRCHDWPYNRAVAEIGPFQFSGIFAWLAWLFIHLLYIVEFENRLVIAVKWAYDYFTHNRGARLITGDQQR